MTTTLTASAAAAAAAQCAGQSGCRSFGGARRRRRRTTATAVCAAAAFCSGCGCRCRRRQRRSRDGDSARRIVSARNGVIIAGKGNRGIERGAVGVAATRETSNNDNSEFSSSASSSSSSSRDEEENNNNYNDADENEQFGRQEVDDGHSDLVLDDDDDDDDDDRQRRLSVRRRVSDLARNVVRKPFAYAAPMPKAVAVILKDATLKAVDMAVEEVQNRRMLQNHGGGGGGGIARAGGADSSRRRDDDDDNNTGDGTGAPLDITTVVDEAFAPMEASLREMERSLSRARTAMTKAKAEASAAMEALQAAQIAQAEGAVTAVQAAEVAAERKVMADLQSLPSELDWTDTGGMAPPFLDEDQCLVPGEPVVRVEKAPENSRRIFAGIDIAAAVDDVWNVLTDYAGLQNVVPNLVVNEVLQLYDGETGTTTKASPSSDQVPEEVQCRELSLRQKGALLKQVGGARVAGINFSARTTLEVREWPCGLPDFAHFAETTWRGQSRAERAAVYSRMKLQRYRFPRPFAVSSLPTRDISMLQAEDSDGEFRMYQGVWRMQPLPGCAPPGSEAMRLTYAVEVSPRAYLPVQLVEGRIVRDLCTNLEAIRDHLVSKQDNNNDFTAPVLEQPPRTTTAAGAAAAAESAPTTA